MSWLNDTEQHRKRQASMIAKAFGGSNIQKAMNNNVSEEEEKKTEKKAAPHGEKSDMYKMKILGLRKFNEQDQKEYIGVENVANSYIANHENGDIIISKTTDGYLVSKFPIDTENEEGDEKETTTLSEAIDVALQYKDDLDNAKAPEQIMYKETEDSDDSEEDDDDSEKGFDDEINPFERAAWEAEQDEIRKAYETLGLEYDEFEKAKHQDGDMHPNGKWVWRASANGGKGDWRVAKKGSSSSGGSGSAGASGGSDSKKLIGFATVSEVKSMMKMMQDYANGVDWTEENNSKAKRFLRLIPQEFHSSDENIINRMNNTLRYLKQHFPELKNVVKKGDTKKSSNTVTHDINGTKVTVTKNSDGSYTLEANGKKVKSDDPSFYVQGTNIKPRVKAALAKKVGIDIKKETVTNKKKEVPNTMVEIHKDLDKKYEDEIKPFTYTSNGVSDLKKQGKTGYALWVGFEHAARGRQPVDRTKMKNFVQNTAIKHLLEEVNNRTGKKFSEKDVKIDDRWNTTDMFRIYVEV